jgi:RNA polymerase sigma factor (sigma-70 family)
VSATSPTDTRKVEQDYARLRTEIMGMLSTAFAQVPDHEEIYQEAWAELLELRAAGKPIGDQRMMLRTIAWRRARQLWRTDHSDPVANSDLFWIPDEGASPDEAAQIHLDAVIARQIVDSLEPRQAAAIKLRFDYQMRSVEIQEYLGVSAKRLEKIVTEANHQLDAQLTPDASGLTLIQRRQRSLLLTCLMGQASPGQLERAREMVAEDASCRAALRELRFSLERIASLAPTPILIDRRDDRAMAIFDRISQVWRSLRDTITNLVSRGDVHVSSEQAAGGAATIGAAGAAKVVIACLAVAGGTAVCVKSLTSSSPPAPKHPAPRPATAPLVTAAAQSVGREPRIRFIATVAPAHKPTRTRHPVNHVTHHHKTRTEAPSDTAHTASPSPAPTGSSEFLPGNVGSTGASDQPAQAPTGGGGEFLP